MTDEQKKILVWLGNGDTGSSSKALALTALGAMPKNPSYPSDGQDLGRCRRLIEFAPEAAKGLPILARDGGEVWKRLVEKWDVLVAAGKRDEARYARNEKKQYECYDMMKSIIHPIENASGSVVRLAGGASIHFGRRSP